MSMASSWPSGDDLMDAPPPRCTPAPAPAQTWGSGTSGPILRHFSAGNGNGTKGCVIASSFFQQTAICQSAICRPDICRLNICRPDICRPDELAAIALSFAAFDNREPERAEMGAERPISASMQKLY